MSIQELLTGGGGLLVLALTVIQVAPVKINPWSAIAKAIGRAVNAEVLAELERTRIKLDNHIKTDDERAADMHRARILQFNNELIRKYPAYQRGVHRDPSRDRWLRKILQEEPELSQQPGYPCHSQHRKGVRRTATKARFHLKMHSTGRG